MVPDIADPLFLSGIMGETRLAMIPMSGRRFYDDETAAQLVEASRYRNVIMDGFEYCEMLNESVVDALTYVHHLGKSLGEANPKPAVFVVQLDRIAKRVTDFIIEKYEAVNLQEAKRYACFAVAEGANPTANVSDTRLFVQLNPQNYFKGIFPISSNIVHKKMRFGIAYLITVSDDQGYNQLIKLIDTLDDGHAIILIHVILELDIQLEKIRKFVDKRKLKKGRSGNVHLAKTRFSHIHGHSSFLFAELAGFFELRDLAEWDYIINMSPYDWPMRKNADIFSILEKNPGFSWIDFWADSESITKRSVRPYLGNAAQDSLYHPQELGITAWPFPEWQTYKQLEWMILSVKAIDYLRYDPKVQSYLAVLEHAYMPQESFFATGNPILHSVIQQCGSEADA